MKIIKKSTRPPMLGSLAVMVLIFALIGTAYAQKPQKPAEEEKPAGSVSHTIKSNNATKRPDQPSSGSITHQVNPQPGTLPRPMPEYIPPKATSGPTVKKAADLNPVRPAGSQINAPKPILVVTDKPNKQPAITHTNRPDYMRGEYYYNSRPNFAPSYYGHWVFDPQPQPFRSAYYYYGQFPYLEPTRVHVLQYTDTGFGPQFASPTVEYSDSGRPSSDLDFALSDIRTAWLDGRLDLISSHVNRDSMVAVLLDGVYNYSVDPTDYLQMTFDAIDSTRTKRFTWENVQLKGNGDYEAFARHTYKNAQGIEQVVYVSYTLKKVLNNYYIVEVGSSKEPLG